MPSCLGRSLKRANASWQPFGLGFLKSYWACLCSPYLAQFWHLFCSTMVDQWEQLVFGQRTHWSHFLWSHLSLSLNPAVWWTPLPPPLLTNPDHALPYWGSRCGLLPLSFFDWRGCNSLELGNMLLGLGPSKFFYPGQVMPAF